MPSPIPRISVILPVRDAEKTLAVAVESILGQTERNFELLVVDDGSTDASLRILQEFAELDGRIRVLSTVNPGIVEALNLGLAEARAPYLARMDADDVSLPERLGLQCDFLDANPKSAWFPVVSNIGVRMKRDSKRLRNLCRVDQRTRREQRYKVAPLRRISFCSSFGRFPQEPSGNLWGISVRSIPRGL